MDLGRQDNEEAATADFLSAQSVGLGDYFTFAVERTRQLAPTVEAAAVRYHVAAQLAGRQFEDATVDVGFGDPTLGDPELVRGPDLLAFADILPAEVPATPLEQHVAEKVHAYTRSYPGGNPSTRVKDLVDLAAMSFLFSFQSGRLRRALETTFASRDTHALPSSLPLPPPQWRAAYRRMADDVDVNSDVAEGYQQVRTFLDPVLAWKVAGDTTWDPTRHTW